jgi:serine/threonine protein kinase
MPDLIGKTLGQYRIVGQIGLGGMATVFKAYQPSMDRYVALSSFDPSDSRPGVHQTFSARSQDHCQTGAFAHPVRVRPWPSLPGDALH